MLLRHVPLPLGYRTLYGERARNRTSNLVVKSHLLCLLSYTPHVYGADCRSRTDDLRFTRPLLWPSELSRLKWSGWQDLNLRPSAPKADALPSCATSRNLCGSPTRTRTWNEGFKGLCATITPSANMWWRWTGSNRRPDACKAPALPTELHPHYICGGRGGSRTLLVFTILRLATGSLSGRPPFQNGGECRI